jgi:hypothetical protein
MPKELEGPPPIERTQEVRNYLAYWAGYIDSHCAMLERYKVHKDIVTAARLMQKEFEGD